MEVPNKQGEVKITNVDENGDVMPVPHESPRKLSRFQVKIVDELPTGTLPRKRDHRASMLDKNDTFNDSMRVSFGQDTHEAVPSIAYYRNILSTTAEAKRRPTLAELHDPRRMDIDNYSPEDKEAQAVIQDQGNKFGWIKGVLVRCLLNIWGVMLFLRLTWITGQAGVASATIIILMSTVVTVLTTLSMSAICTNGQVKGGGAYYMISRSLGPEFGGSIGLIFSLANAVAVSMYVVGFSETTRDLLHDHNLIMVDEINDVRIIGVITLVVCLGITMIGMAWEARAQLVLLVILICSIIVLIVGSALQPSQEEFAKGFVGFDATTFKENFGPAYTNGESFFSVFSIFFPAATGILAGANISGDLRDAQKAIPKGTLLAILITSVLYIGLVWLLGAVMVREATGNVADYFPASVANVGLVFPSRLPMDTVTADLGICGAQGCKFGLLWDLQAAYVISAFAPCIIAGIFAATLSSALASLVSAPKVFQAVCKDNVFPKTKFFAKGVGPADEPKRAYILTFVIALGFIALGELNAIAPIISNFFLASYALINFSCFSASLSKTPGWRPAFKYYNKWVALLAAVICVAVMFLINWYAACITAALIAALYIYVSHKNPEINWGSSTQALTYKQALQCTVKLLSIPEHTKTFRPQCLVFSGAPECRPALVNFVSHITKNNSLLICGNVIVGDQEENLDKLNSTSGDHINWLLKQKIKGFYSPIIASSLRTGAQSLLQISGLGKLKPNTMFLGFKSNWQKDSPCNVVDYVGIIHDAFDLNYGVCILRFPQGLDVSAALNPHAHLNGRKTSIKPINPTIEESEPLILEESFEKSFEKSLEKDLTKSQEAKADKPLIKPVEDSTALMRGHKPGSVIKSVNAFQEKQAKGTVDVWWLFDDGGLTLLIPHILTLRRQWERCKLRVFAGGKKDQIEKEKISMASMLSKFRIDCQSVEIIPDIGKKPQDVSLQSFESLVEPWLLNEDDDKNDFPGYITREEKKNLKEKTYRNIRLRELLFKHSKNANLIFLTLPMPRKEACSAYMYMAWLETLCNAKDLPPIVLMRGNQTSVLTYYS